MNWPMMLALSFAGLAASMVANVMAVYQGNRYRKWLPKRDVYESLEALQLRLSDKEEEYDLLREKLYEANATITEAESQRTWMEKTREDVAELHNQEKELRDIEQKIDKASTDWNLADDRLTKVRGELTNVEEALQRQQSQLLSDEELQEQKQLHENLTNETRTLAAQQMTLTTAIETMNSRLDEVRDERTELVSQLAELRVEEQALKETAAGLSSRCVSLEKQLEELKQRNQQLGGSSASTDEDRSTELLWDPIIKVREGHPVASANLDEQEALSRAETYIRDSGLVYDQRVLRAFHTSLKCSEESPLLVLAGISGTGKSALPTRYAEAMGMNILNVPVQPGWDSPADLLGFYNHLEGRFRPTELTRALLQMDYVHQARSEQLGGEMVGDWPLSASSRVDLSDRMLLVLLDEMNLARVEYYFSEFLSRLETRRDIDPRDAIKRMKAELVLDLGTAGEGRSQALQLFTGSNVLFVGTMNEDESTQTLSDKVIDRSNLMRFGKPNRLVLTDSALAKKPAVPAYLPRSVWHGWITGRGELGTQYADQVRVWTDDVNELLNKIGRPFAHRVAKAISTYVKHYPDPSEKGLREAFADQVELRVLPRLRGLDIHDPNAMSVIQGITTLVELKLQDTTLASALEDARSHSGDQLFHWSGVDRLRVNA